VGGSIDRSAAPVSPGDSQGLSVVIVTWNRRAQVLKLVGQLLGQLAECDELVVLDNGSSDHTTQAIAEIFPTVTLISEPINHGCPGGRNRAVAHATKTWAVCLDDDSTIPDDLITMVKELVKRHPEAAVISGWARDPVIRPKPRYREGPINTFSGGICILERATFLELGGYPEDGLREGEERDLCVRLLAGDRCIIHSHDLWVWHTPNAGSSREPAVLRGVVRQDLVTACRYPPTWIMPAYVVSRLIVQTWRAVQRRQLRPLGRGLQDVITLAPGTRSAATPLTTRQFTRYLRRRWQHRPRLADRAG
jgi:hypothetical protein